MYVMTTRRITLTLEPTVLRWARERAGLQVEGLAKKLGIKPERVQEWEHTGQISMSQVSRLSRATYTAEGLLFLDEPPEEVLPIADLRTVGDKPVARPSPNLLETVYDMQRRQAWMRDELISDEVEPLPFVGSFTLLDRPESVAHAIKRTLALESDWAARESTWENALRRLRDCIEDAGILVAVNGVVGNNTSRKLDPDEFRGFALIDEFAPLLFINNSDYKSAQMFTFAHELAHVFVGEEGVSTLETMLPIPHETEEFCNKVAAEFLIPREALTSFWVDMEDNANRFSTVARRFKVSGVVAARRALDLSLIDRDSFFSFYWQSQEEERHRQETGSGGGNFWTNQNVRVGRRFGQAIARAAKEGRLSYREGYSLTGLRGPSFDKFIERVAGTAQ